MISRLARERAKRGATFLDQEKPGWVHLIDLTKLDMGSSYYCVLGQLGPPIYSINLTQTPYGVMTEELMLTYRQQASHGFCADSFHPSFDELNDAWKEEIAKRSK